MAYRRIDIASRAADIANGGIGGATALAAEYHDLATALESFTTAAKSASEAFKTLSLAEKVAEDGKKESKAEKPDTFWFFERNNKSYESARKNYKEMVKERIGLAAEEFTALEGYSELHKARIQSQAAVHSKAYQAMGDQMLQLIEIGHFSVGAFAKVVAQQVKIELVGLAAKAAVWAIYETAMGLRDLAAGSPTAGLHFASAAEFGVVAGASLAAAAGVQAVLFGGTDERAPSGSGRGAAHGKQSAGFLPMSLDSNPQTRQNQDITVHIYNPLSDHNWQKIVEDNIVPALNNAADRNISITVKNT